MIIYYFYISNPRTLTNKNNYESVEKAYIKKFYI